MDVYLKENGFLGICSYSLGDLFLASKSTNQGEFAERFKRIMFQEYNSSLLNIIRLYCEKYNVSFIFEVIDPIEDPHIVEYDKKELVLLDVVYNSLEYKKFFSYCELESFSEKYSIKCKKKIYTLNSSENFIDFYTKAKKEKMIEGYVLEDQSGFQVKLKTDWYKYWKRMRIIFQAIKSEKYTDEQIEKKYRISFSNNPMFQYMKLSEAKNIVEFRKSFIDRKKNM